MYRLDSDLMGILLAILTFAIPAVSSLFEKRRKEKRRRDASAFEETRSQYPDSDSPFSFSEDASSQDGAEDAAMEQISHRPIAEDERAREIEELFEVLLGVQKKPAQEEPAVQEAEPVVPVEPIAPQTGEMAAPLGEPLSGGADDTFRDSGAGARESSGKPQPQEELFEEAVPASGEALQRMDAQMAQHSGGETGADAPAARKSLKERLKEHPEDMVLFAEIMKPKFKEF